MSDEKPQINIETVLVNPDLARDWLRLNTHNRNVRQIRVQRYRNDMEQGRWQFSADPIRFDYNGVLIDGQHRLLALADLDSIAIPMLVVRGLDPESQIVMDQGTARNPGDQLRLHGYKDANALAAAVRQYLIWQRGYLFRDNKAASAAITNVRVVEWVENHPAEVARLLSMIGLTKQNDAPPSIAAAALIEFGRIDPDMAREFMTLLARGAGTEGHPILTLDKRLQRIRREGMKMPNRDYLALFILSWNAWREGREMTKFQRPRGGKWNEDNFPEPR